VQHSRATCSTATSDRLRASPSLVSPGLVTGAARPPRPPPGSSSLRSLRSLGPCAAWPRARSP
jgi:hypothetical protein